MTDEKKHEPKPYPIYCETDDDLTPGLYLALFHGFKDEQARLEHIEGGGGWGANGPVIGPLRHVQTTYMTHIKFEFVDPRRARVYGLDEGFPDLHVDPQTECVMFDGMEYGDWTVAVMPDPRR